MGRKRLYNFKKISAEGFGFPRICSYIDGVRLQ
jgi:hypothetical protein